MGYQERFDLKIPAYSKNNGFREGNDALKCEM